MLMVAGMSRFGLPFARGLVANQLRMKLRGYSGDPKGIMPEDLMRAYDSGEEVYLPIDPVELHSAETIICSSWRSGS